MWRRVTVKAAVDHPVEQVFTYLADPASWHEFVPAVALRRPLSGGPTEIGSTWQSVDRIGPFKIRFTDTLLELEPGRRVAWGSSAPWNARTEYVLEAVGDATRVTATYEGDIGGWLRLLAWLPGPIVAWILSRDFKRLDAMLTRQARSSPS